MQNGTITTCNALFYDDGGANYSYSNNKDYTLTIYPDNNNNTLQVTFSEFNTENGYDFLYIYDGSSTNSTLIGKYSGSSSPGTVKSSTQGGALTFKFTSDSYENGTGWAALIKCIEPLEPLEVQATATPESIIEGQSTQLTATVQGGTGQYTYSWEPANTLDNAESATPVATPVETTTYIVTVDDGDSNDSASVTVIVTPDGIIETTHAFKIYPNPVNDEVKIEMSDKNARSTYRLFNVTGQELGKGTIRGTTSISTANLEKGVYFIEISSEGMTTTSKILVK